MPSNAAARRTVEVARLAAEQAERRLAHGDALPRWRTALDAADRAGVSTGERTELLAAYGLPRSGMDALIEETAALLGLHAYYTQGPAEARAWVVARGATAAEAAGAIHSDMQAGFIKADVIGYADFVAAGEAAARAKGLARQEGKDYVVQTGDVMTFKFKS